VVSVTASVDGRVTLNRASRLLDEAAGRIWDSIHPGSADGLFAARRAEIERRYAPQVVLEGSGTFVADTDGPITGLPAPSGGIAALYDDFLPAQAGGRWFAVVDGRGRIRWTHKTDAGRRLLVIVSRATPPPYLAQLRNEDVPYLVAGDGPVDLDDALRTMKGRLGATCVVSEAGGGLNGALLRSGLVDELHLMLLPSLVGGLGTPTIFDGVPLSWVSSRLDCGCWRQVSRRTASSRCTMRSIARLSPPSAPGISLGEEKLVQSQDPGQPPYRPAGCAQGERPAAVHGLLPCGE
jgi:2,5-diamino-6-(ribosylamino)-4(3H)-pyrimidinone 5'-phosphate reductase